ncbi:MAG: DMT family transporter [Planctomycetota bacterium]
MERYTGEVFGLGAACMWSIGSLLFSRVRVAAAAMNLFKNTVGATLLLFTLLGIAFATGESPFHPSAAAWMYLGASAIVGLAIGDTCFFRSLQILGPRRALVVTMVAPPAAVLLGWTVLGEAQTPFAVAGVILTLTGVAWVVRERGLANESPGHFPSSPVVGLVYGVAGSVCQAVGALWAKQGIQALAAVGAPRPAMEASFLRLLAAVIAGLIVGLAARRLRVWGAQLRAPGHLPRLIPAAFCGTYLGIWFSLLAFQHTSIGVASTLTSTSPIFVLPLVWFFLRQKITVRALLGTCVAIGGVVLLFIGRTPN